MTKQNLDGDSDNICNISNDQGDRTYTFMSSYHDGPAGIKHTINGNEHQALGHQGQAVKGKCQVRSLKSLQYQFRLTMPEDKITVLQLNMNKAYNAGIDLMGKINKTSCFLALLQEPYCYKGTFAAIPGRADFIPSARTGGPRAAIYAD